MNRIEVIESSLRCFTCGLLALIPIFGLPCVLFAFTAFRQSRGLPAGEWNPASSYALAGLVCAVLGLLLSLVIISVLSWAIMNELRERF